jgi:glycosyltransferase involved in cell wall biosynthesis
VGGGMFKVADYLIQAQREWVSQGYARLRPLDTRGGSSAVFSLFVLLTAVARLLWGRLTGRLAGVHVNMAERLSLLRKAIIVVASRALGLPVVLHLHAAQLHHFYRSLPRPIRALTRWVFSLPSACIVLGEAGRRFVTEELGVPHEKVEIVINGVPQPSRPRRVQTACQSRRILFVGNLSERKGISDLLRALALPAFNRVGVKAIIAGGGALDRYRSQATALAIDDFVSFEGWADQSKVAELLSAADVLILPSYDEGLPLVILEAMANGVAVICTPVGEIPQEFCDGVEVKFVQPGDAEGIARALNEVLGDPALQSTLERNGQAAYEQKFSLQVFFDHIARVHRRQFGVSGQSRLDAGLPPLQ